MAGRLTAFLAGVGTTGAGSVAWFLWQRRIAADTAWFSRLRGAFDRPAFTCKFRSHTDQQAFRESLAAVLRTIGAGAAGPDTKRPRGGRAEHQPSRKQDRSAMLDVRKRLQAILQRSEDLADASIADDQERLTQEIEENLDAVIEAMNRMWQPRGIHTMRLPSEAQTRSAFGRGTG
jgi:hypothetical protein